MTFVEALDQLVKSLPSFSMCKDFIALWIVTGPSEMIVHIERARALNQDDVKEDVYVDLLNIIHTHELASETYTVGEFATREVKVAFYHEYATLALTHGVTTITMPLTQAERIRLIKMLLG